MQINSNTKMLGPKWNILQYNPLFTNSVGIKFRLTLITSANENWSWLNRINFTNASYKILK